MTEGGRARGWELGETGEGWMERAVYMPETVVGKASSNLGVPVPVISKVGGIGRLHHCLLLVVCGPSLLHAHHRPCSGYVTPECFLVQLLPLTCMHFCLIFLNLLLKMKENFY